MPPTYSIGDGGEIEIRQQSLITTFDWKNEVQNIFVSPTIAYAMLCAGRQNKKPMMNIQKKSLQHVSETLKSFDTYPIYKAIIDAMTDAGI